jgi:tRNA threonylcarbamoyladenosine biosynthesis protein TsaE
MATFISHSSAETETLGESWGRAAAGGLVIGVTGELGAGKTQLVKGVARGLGIRQRVHSPTFTLVNIYPGGRLTLFHLDLYRLESIDQILAAGLEEYLRPDGVAVIEWAERLLVNEPASSSGEGAPSGITSLMPGGNVKVASLSSGKTGAETGLLDSFRWVRIEALSATSRRITYEDIGA